MIEPLQRDEAFLADVASAPRAGVHLWWLGQSGYLVAWGGRRLLLDPYLSDSLTRKYADTPQPHDRMTRRVVDPGKLTGISIITSSHAHTDHLDGETLSAVREASGGKPVLVAVRMEKALARQRWGGDEAHTVLLSDGESWSDGEFWGDGEFGGEGEPGGVNIHAVVAAHDKIERNDAGDSRYLGYVIEIGGVRIYHSGDTVHHPEVVQQVKPWGVDLALVPINGKLGNMEGQGAARVAHEVGAKLAVPCHYEMFEFNTADPRERFIPGCERLGQAYRVLRAGERLTIGSS